MLLKFLVVILVIAVVYLLFFHRPKSGAVTKKPKKPRADDTFVPCETCGVYVSVDEALLRDGRYYCSDTCLTKA